MLLAPSPSDPLDDSQRREMLESIATVQRQFFQSESPNVVFGILLDTLLKLTESEYGFIGEIKQIPPMYSALKQNGKRLYKLARKGVEVERQPREIVIYDFEITKIKLPEIDFKIRCSKGTYIRVIANDFGIKLNCGAYLKSLRREAIGEFRVENSITVDEFREMNKILESWL